LNGDGGGPFKAVVAVVTVMVIFVVPPPAGRGVAGAKVALAPAGRPLAVKLTLYRNVVATCGCT
jgi:hypothetical protein